MKKFFAIFLVLIMGLINITPILAETAGYEQGDVLSTSVEEDKIYLVPKSIFTLELESDLDVNESTKGDEIYFRLVTPVKASNGMYLPENTRFKGIFKKIKQSSPMFKRARAYIIIDKMLMPNGTEYTVRMEPKNGSDLKSSQFLNTLRAVPASIGVLTFSVLSVATVAIESATIVGLVVVPRTCKGFGVLISSTAKGLNFKLKTGSQLLFKLNTAVYVSADDLKM